MNRKPHTTKNFDNPALAHTRINDDEIVKIIVDRYGPVKKIILFGSQARNQADAYSDVDLIVIKNTRKRFVQRLIEAPSLPVPADIFVYTPEEFENMQENENPFIVNALHGARVIYEKS